MVVIQKYGTNPSRDLWFQSYIQTYFERDVRDVLALRDLSSFRRFLSLVALANGQMLNKSSMAAPLGVSVPTIAQWLSVLETSGLIALVPAYCDNFQKRCSSRRACTGWIRDSCAHS